MSMFQFCRVCLRTDCKLRKLDGLVLKFFEELCEISGDKTKKFCCPICEHLLRKTLNFKKKCQKSNEIFQQWKKNKNKPSLSKLFEFLPPSSYSKSTGDKCKEIHITEAAEFTDVTIKVEKYDVFDNNDLDKYKKTDDGSPNYKAVDVDSTNYKSVEVDSTNYKTVDDDLRAKADEVMNKSRKELSICDNDYQYKSDTSEDFSLLDYIKESKKKGLKHKKRKLKNRKIKVEDSKCGAVKTKPKLPKQRRPLKDHKEYETVFDIQLFTTEAEVMEEFAQRKTSEHYVTAKHKCEVCFTVYKCEKLVNFHMRWHDPAAGEFPCDVCAMRFKTHVSMRKHKTDVHFGRFVCKKCPLITYHKMVMILHYRKHQGVSYICKICKRTYNHSSTYMSHLRKSHPTEHVCVTCAQTFVSEKGLTVHRKKVHNLSSKFDDEGTARCEPCQITFTNQQVYTVHVMNTDKHRDIADTLIACPECGLEFADKLQVRAHRRQLHPQYNFSAMKRAESGERGHNCPLCGLSGNHNTWLYRHFQSAHPAECYELRVRSARRTHLCDQCGKSFYNITQLREHSYAHSGLKPFRCERCPAAFRSKSHLKFHSERHAPPSRECSHCGKKFVSAANLSNHMRSHIGDRRYKCSLCGKGFLHCAALREHIRGVHLHIRRQRKTTTT